MGLNRLLGAYEVDRVRQILQVIWVQLFLQYLIHIRHERRNQPISPSPRVRTQEHAWHEIGPNIVVMIRRQEILRYRNPQDSRSTPTSFPPFPGKNERGMRPKLSIQDKDKKKKYIQEAKVLPS